jgi:multicomponent Na+:H+ antiporter subunit G
MRDIVITASLSIGTFFIILAGVGVFRMPDLYMRLSAAAKASTFGTSFLLLAVAVFFDSSSVTGQVIAIIVFVVLTVPIAAHMISRAAYFNKVPLWKESVYDDLQTDLNGATRKEEEKADGTAP